jgi:thioredoxin reductase (NADPH)
MPIVAPETPEQHALWFPKLSDAQIDQLASSSVPRQVNPREILFDQGTSDRGVFVVLSGSIEIIGVSNGVESVLTTLAPGEFTGEVTQLSGRRSLVLCRALRIKHTA